MLENPTQSVPATEVAGKTLVEEFMGKRYASFVATTNNPRPLQDTTGSRRYLCVEIPQDTIILNDHPIDYDQLYAQVVYEIREQHLPYWFTPAETRRIEEMNVKFQHVSDLMQGSAYFIVPVKSAA